MLYINLNSFLFNLKFFKQNFKKTKLNNAIYCIKYSRFFKTRIFIFSRNKI